MNSVDLGTVQASVDLNLGGLKSGIDQATRGIGNMVKQIESELSGLHNSGERAGSQTGQSLGSIGRSATGMAATVASAFNRVKNNMTALSGVMQTEITTIAGHTVQLSDAAIGAGGAIVYGFKKASDAGSELETTFLHVGANTNMTAAQIADMRGKLLDLATISPAPIEQLANGFMHASNYGYSAADAMSILQAAMKSAVATGGNTADTANILSGVLHEFGIEARYAQQAMDALHTAAAQGNMTLEQLVTAGGPAFAMAASLKVGFTETAAAMSALTRHGFDAAEAATQVKDVLAHIVSPQNIEGLKALSKYSNINLSADFTATGLANRGLFGVVQDIRQATSKGGMAGLGTILSNFTGQADGKGNVTGHQDVSAKQIKQLSKIVGFDLVGAFKQGHLSEEQYKQGMDALAKASENGSASIMKIIPAIRGGLGMMVLATQGFGDYKAILDQVNDAMAGKLPASAEGYNRILQSQGAATAILKNQLAVLCDQISVVLLPITRNLTQAISGLVQWFLHLSPGMQRAIVNTALFVGVGLTLLGTVGKIMGVLEGLGKAWAALKEIQVIGALVTRASALWAGFSATLAGVAEGIATVGAVIFELAGGWIPTLIAAVVLLVVAWENNWGHIREVVASALAWMRPYLQAAWGWIRDEAVAAWQWIARTWDDFWAGLLKTIIGWGDSAKRAAGDAVKAIADGIRDFADDPIGAVQNMMAGATDSVAQSASDGYSAGVNWAKSVAQGVKDGYQATSDYFNKPISEDTSDKARLQAEGEYGPGDMPTGPSVKAPSTGANPYQPNGIQGIESAEAIKARLKKEKEAAAAAKRQHSKDLKANANEGSEESDLWDTYAKVYFSEHKQKLREIEAKIQEWTDANVPDAVRKIGHQALLDQLAAEEKKDRDAAYQKFQDAILSGEEASANTPAQKHALNLHKLQVEQQRALEDLSDSHQGADSPAGKATSASFQAQEKAENDRYTNELLHSEEDRYTRMYEMRRTAKDNMAAVDYTAYLENDLNHYTKDSAEYLEIAGRMAAVKRDAAQDAADAEDRLFASGQVAPEEMVRRLAQELVDAGGDAKAYEAILGRLSGAVSRLTEEQRTAFETGKESGPAAAQPLQRLAEILTSLDLKGSEPVRTLTSAIKELKTASDEAAESARKMVADAGIEAMDAGGQKFDAEYARNAERRAEAMAEIAKLVGSGKLTPDQAGAMRQSADSTASNTTAGIAVQERLAEDKASDDSAQKQVQLNRIGLQSYQAYLADHYASLQEFLDLEGTANTEHTQQINDALDAYAEKFKQVSQDLAAAAEKHWQPISGALSGLADTGFSKISDALKTKFGVLGQTIGKLLTDALKTAFEESMKTLITRGIQKQITGALTGGLGGGTGRGGGGAGGPIGAGGTAGAVGAAGGVMQLFAPVVSGLKTGSDKLTTGSQQLGQSAVQSVAAAVRGIASAVASGVSAVTSQAAAAAHQVAAADLTAAATALQGSAAAGIGGGSAGGLAAAGGGTPWGTILGIGAGLVGLVSGLFGSKSTQPPTQAGVGSSDRNQTINVGIHIDQIHNHTETDVNKMVEKIASVTVSQLRTRGGQPRSVPRF